MSKLLYERCEELFIDYPLAIRPLNQRKTVRSIVLILADAPDVRYFVLLQERTEDPSIYSLCPWHECDRVDIEENNDDSLTKLEVNAITRAVPVPRHGSLFGWRSGDTISALIAFHADYTPDCPEPSWKVMPLVGISQDCWPPFTHEPLLGHWFWSHYQAGRIVSLGGLIAGKPNTVFWTDRAEVLGRDCCVVSHDIPSREGFTLSAGRYVSHESLHMGEQVPPVGILLADVSKIDLAPRFRSSECDRSRTTAR